MRASFVSFSERREASRACWVSEEATAVVRSSWILASAVAFSSFSRMMVVA